VTLPRLSTRQVVAFWVLTRTGMLVLTALYFQGDCATYFRHGRQWLDGQTPYRDYPVEYPPAATAVFALVAAAGSYPRFRVAFILLTLLLDGLCLALLLRRTSPTGSPPDSGTPRELPPALVYAAASAPLFPVLFVRFDLLPATACLAGLLALARARAPLPIGPAVAVGSAIGLAIALKLYPLLLVPFLVLYARRVGLGLRSSLLAAATGVGVVIASFLPVWAASAGAAAFDFLRFQGGRGIQLESSYASLLLLANQIVPFGLAHQASHNAHDVVGPGVHAAGALAKLLQPLSVLAVSWLAHRRRLDLLAACAAVLVAALLTANVFSPQFLIWLLPLAAVPLARSPIGTLTLLAATALTAAIFPALYPRLIQGATGPVLVLCARNLLLALVLVQVLRPQAAPAGADQPRRR
jgi:hypothetical protein